MTSPRTGLPEAEKEVAVARVEAIKVALAAFIRDTERTAPPGLDDHGMFRFAMDVLATIIWNMPPEYRDKLISALSRMQNAEKSLTSGGREQNIDRIKSHLKARRTPDGKTSRK
jgi:hypothetical protein